ncbi:hypothetical protein AMK59_5531 [Oryctes borbonicus]|uniref:FK506-binding protein n=1 Tax=Oryctes borbonicus TaxID=1629725 RepID=A0A0T6B2C8_9SCAR|nr:hypothetical protein AMK59_5531 [Oryctes borbonicus]
MFWGLIMEPQRRYSQTVKKAFHISMAALDESTSDDSPTQVICSYDDRNYLLCTLQKGNTIQVPLDLNYEIGDKISFATNGKAHVHLTGYLLEEQFPTDEGEEEEDDEDEVVESGIGKKRQKKDQSSSPPKKKSKTLELLNAVNSNDEDDSDDSDVNMSDLMDEEDDAFDTTLMEEEEDQEDEEEEGDEEEDEGESEDDEEEVEGEESDAESSSLSDDDLVKQTKKVMENGVASKKRKGEQQKPNQQQQAPTQLQKSKKQKKEKPVKSDKTPPKSDKSPVKSEKTTGKTEKTPAKGDKTPNKADGKTPNKSPKQEGGSPQKRTIEGGVVIEDVKIGGGPAAKPGKFVKVYYEGRFKNNNKMFDSTTKGPGFEFRLGRQEVIKGWDVGLAGMKVGGKRRITCPPNMAYGQKGSPPTIPPNSTLVFDVELKNVK